MKLGTVKDFEERHRLNSQALAALARSFQHAGLLLFLMTMTMTVARVWG